MKHIKKLVFGERASGEILALPKIKTTIPINQPTEDDWVKEVKFGNRYGHRGSFYERR